MKYAIFVLAAALLCCSPKPAQHPLEDSAPPIHEEYRTVPVAPCAPQDAGTPIASDGGIVTALGPDAVWEVHFSPSGGCTEAIIRLIASAKSTIYLQAYSFTSKPIIGALINAKSRGVEVIIVLDKTFDAGVVRPLLDANAAIYIDSAHTIAHNKVLIVDNFRLQTGSFNYSHNAEYRNAENCLITHNVGLAGAYAENFHAHRAHSSRLPK